MITLTLALAAALAGAEAFDYDRAAPLDVKLEVKGESVSQQAGTAVHAVSYASPGGRVQATLVVPEGTGPFAGILLQHGIPDDRNTPLQTASSLARTGAVILLIDAPYGREPNAGRQAGPFTFTAKDRDEQVQHVVDLCRGIDLLLSRPDVDPKRLGYLGRDHGAGIGAALAGIDKRIKAYALAVPDGGLVAVATGKSERGQRFRRLSEARRALWLAAMEPIDPVRLVAAAAPATLFFQGAQRDTVVPEEDVVRLYEAASEPKRIEWYDTDHALDTAALRAQIGWLAEQLGLDGQKFWQRPKASPGG